MNGFKVIPNGVYLERDDAIIKSNRASLMFHSESVEMIHYQMPASLHGTFNSLENPGDIEIYYVLEGRATLYTEFGEEYSVNPGDTFCLAYGNPLITFIVEEDIKFILYCNFHVYSREEENTSRIVEVLKELQQRDGDTFEHCERVKDLVLEIARIMKYPVDDIQMLTLAARFHDVGKCRIPLEIVIKPDKLDEEEYALMKKHSEYSADIIRPLFGDRIADIALWHHERPDGKGYPKGITLNEIPLEARMISVADAYDAMITVRPYNAGKTKEEAIAELQRCAGTQFDKVCVEALCQYLLWEEKKK